MLAFSRIPILRFVAPCSSTSLDFMSVRCFSVNRRGESHDSYSRSRDVSRRPFREQTMNEPAARKQLTLSARPADRFTKNEKQCLWYGQQCSVLLESGKIRECLSLFDEMMSKADLTPSLVNFSVAISAAAKTGNITKAFEYFEKMESCGVKPNVVIFASLFECLANAKHDDELVARVAALREQMKAQAIKPNDVVYRTMMKALMNCGDFAAALAVVDEMRAVGVEADEATFRHLMHGALRDKRAGFLFAILVARQMVLHPHVVSDVIFGHLLKVCRNCKIGDTEEAMSQLNMSDLLDEREPQSFRPRDVTEHAFLDWRGTRHESLADYVVHPEFVPPRGFGKLLVDATSERGTPTHRLALIGGVDGVLRQMELLGVVPSILHFTQFLHLIPNWSKSDEFLLEKISACKLRSNSVFLIQLRARCARRENRLATIDEYLTELSKHEVVLDADAFNALALECGRAKDMDKLLRAMKKQSVKTDFELFERLMTTALHRKFSPGLGLAVLREVARSELPPTDQFMRTVEEGIRILVGMSRNPTNVARFGDENFRAEAAHLRSKFREYEKQVFSTSAGGEKRTAKR